ncbi:hypothetical protein PUG46_14435 [Erwiniaceae bacterium L1_55_4]|nr:hypothetical protein [Erwiniaceae bacterium L1_55_4]
MAIIIFGRSVKPLMKNNSKSRRHMRRMLIAMARRKEEQLSGEQNEVKLTTHHLKVYESKSINELKSNDRVSKAIETETDYHKQILAESEKFREHKRNINMWKVNNNEGRIIHVLQKTVKKSTILI